MSKETLYTGIAVAVTVIVVGVFFIIGVPFSTQSIDTSTADLSQQGATQAAAGAQTTTPAATPVAPVAPAAAVAAAASGKVGIQEEAAGAGTAAKTGDTVTINYTGALTDGTVFDSSVGKQPFSFTLGAGQVIPGFDQGLAGAKVGTKRILVIPASLGYGAQAVGPIPANSTLVFEIQVVGITPAK